MHVAIVSRTIPSWSPHHAAGSLVSCYELEYPVTDIAWSPKSWQLVTTHDFNQAQLDSLERLDEVGGYIELDKAHKDVLDRYTCTAPVSLWEYEDLGLLDKLKVGGTSWPIGCRPSWPWYQTPW